MNSANKKPLINVSFTVRDINNIQVTFDQFHPAIADAISDIATQEQQEEDNDDDANTWLFAFSSHQAIKNKLLGLTPFRMEVSDVPFYVKNFLIEESKRVNTDAARQVTAGKSVDGIPLALLNQLYPYQRQGVANGRVLIGDEMGLGKTIQALTLALYYQKEWPLLIICPSSVKHAWKDEILKFTAIPLSCIHTINKGSDPLPPTRKCNTSTVIITSYDIMKKVQLAYLNIRVLILDESHLLKDGRSQRAKAAKELAEMATRVILLTGTPAMSRPNELYPQISIIKPTLFYTYRQFALRYCAGQDNGYGFESRGATNTSELRTILKSGIMIRRLKQDVLPDLPEKRREMIYLAIDSSNDDEEEEEMVTAMVEIRKKLNALGEQADEKSSKERASILLHYYQITAKIKAKFVPKYIVDSYLDGSPQKMLIFAHHMIMLDTIEQLLDEKGVQYIRIDGKTNNKKREELCKRFQEDEEVMVAILGIQAAGIGITLTAANTVIMAELGWTPASMLQAEDRAHRIGQKSVVNVKYILAKNTADDDMWPMLNDKLKVLNSLDLSPEPQRSHIPNRIITDYISELEAEQDENEEQEEISDDDSCPYSSKRRRN